MKLSKSLGPALVIIIPLLGLVAAIYQWQYVQGIDIFLFFLMYLLTGFGITIGYHRCFTHHSFKAKTWLKRVLHILGAMAGQGYLIDWASTHRHHHRFTDVEGDPHSPMLQTQTIWEKCKVLYHAHAGWLFGVQPELSNSYATDLLRDETLVKIDNLFLLWTTLGLIIPAVMGGLWTQSWMGAWMGFLWGGLVRMATCQHVTWAVNSIGHMLGTKNYTTNDNSRDNVLLGILALGEGWHNAHHAFPTSARHGLKWWQIDFSYAMICLFSKLGWVWELRLPHKDPKSIAL